MKYCNYRDVTSVYSLNWQKLPGRFFCGLGTRLLKYWRSGQLSICSRTEDLGTRLRFTIMMYIICVVKVKLCSSNYWFYVQRHYMHISLQYIVAFLDVSRQFFACERGKIHLVICLFSFQCKCDELLVPCLFNLTQDIRYEHVL